MGKGETMKCKICKEREEETKTLDNTGICHKCYIEVFNELFKGQFTIQEALKVLEEKAEYNKYIEYYLTLLKINAIKTSKVSSYFEEVLSKEQELSIKVFNKERNILKREEHLVIMNLFAGANIGKVKRVRVSGINTTILKNTYLNNMEYIYT